VKDQIKIAVIGVGHLGKHHVEHFHTIKEAHLVGVYDIDKNRSEKISNLYGIQNFDNIDTLLNKVNAVSVVTPTSEHKSVALKCIENRKHVFIEKPITSTVSDADDLIALARKQNTIIQVGHIERLNPALLPLKDYDINPRFIEIQRLAPYMERGSDVPVVLDLMIHDIDLVLTFVSSAIKDIKATGISIMTNSVDIANARIRFENGCVANLTSSRVAKDRVRKMKLFQQDLYITVDLLMSLTEVYKAVDQNNNNIKTIMSAPLESNGHNRQILYEKPKIVKNDALKMELKNFLAAVKKEEEPIVDGEAGRRALDLAIKIQDKILESFKT
tara:strand:- start:1422 stop:2411 length:990 start_codon:yes stop_codon:yes gene_type:complete